MQNKRFELNKLEEKALLNSEKDVFLAKKKKLFNKLRTLFEYERKELDFGINKINNLKWKRIQQFLNSTTIFW